MVHYVENVSIVMDTLKKYQYEPSSIQSSEKCYDELYQFLSDEGQTFSRKEALLWSESLFTEGSRNPYSPAINRLADVYEYGHILAGHMRIHVQLAERFQSAIDSYVESLDLCKGYILSLRASCTHFCGFLQCNDILTFEDISYKILDSYRGFVNETNGFYRDYVKNAGHFLKFLAISDLTRPAFTLYLNNRYSSKCITLGDMSLESQRIIEKNRHKEGNIPAKDFYNSIKDMSDQMDPFGYSDNLISYTSFYLTLLYIFLDKESLGYCRAIADAWLEGMGDMKFAPKRVRTVRRTFDLYDDYSETGKIQPLHRPRHLGSAYERLPSWCKESVDDFLASKKKAGLSDGSIREFKSQASIFCEFLVSEGLSAFSGLTPEAVKRFNLLNGHMLPRTKNNYNGGVRQFLIHMELRHLVNKGIHFALPACYAGGEKIVTVLEETDRKCIHEYCQSASSQIELRDTAILMLGMNTALRACDILSLRISDIDWKEKLIKVIQRKTSVEHLHSVDVGTLNAVFRYLKDARPKNAITDKIFVSTIAPYGSLTSSVCNDALIRAGSSVSDFHRLRRTYATDSIAGGATPEETAELLGQSDTRSLHRYASLDRERMRLCPLSLDETGLTMERGRYDA